ncbi:MAG TPA: hypothetical protein VJN18_18370 [Polyangiaceae bacterium]|nr:hypothetical protein [Polyangiaceae bacterium]
MLLAAFVLLSLSALSPMLVTRYLPLTDLGFNGLAGLLPHVLLGDSFLNEWYKINWQPVPYWSTYVLQGALSLLLGPTLAVKTTTAIVVLLVPLALMRLALALDRDPRVALLGFILVWDKNLYWGWLSFQFGMAVCIWALARLAECYTLRQAMRLWPLTLLIGVSHAHAIVLLAVAGMVIALSGRPWPRVLLNRSVALSATLVPVGVWLLASVARRRRSGPLEVVGAPLWERITSVYRYTLDNFVLELDRSVSWGALLAVLVTPFLMLVLRKKPTRASENRWFTSLALFGSALLLYLILPFEISGRVSHWWTYPRYATYALLGLLLLPRPDLSGRRGLVLLPAFVMTLALHLTTLKQFGEFGRSVEPLAEIEAVLPEHQRLYPVSYQDSVPSVPGWAIISLHGYLAMEKKAYDPHLFDVRDTPLRFKKRLAQHDWGDPKTFQFEEHASEYDYVLLYRPPEKHPLRAAQRKGEVRHVKTAGPWSLYRVIEPRPPAPPAR